MEIEEIEQKMKHTLKLAKIAHNPKIWEKIPETEKENIRQYEAMVLLLVKQYHTEFQDFLDEFERIKNN